MVAWRRRPIPRVMQCPRQGFVWTEWERFNAPETNLAGNLPAETGSCGRRICSRRRGGSPDFPRRRRPRCIAPCGGVVGLSGRPATSLPCRRKPAATGTDMTPVFMHCAPSPPNLVGSVGGTANAGSCASAAGARDRGLRPLIPGASDKAGVAAYAGATARPAGSAAAPAGAPGCGRGSTAT
jgi:hypothetical protein